MSSDRLSDRRFGIFLSVVLMIYSGVGWFVFDVFVIPAFGAGCAFLAMAILIPWVLMPINRLWHFLAARLAVFTNHFILGLFYVSAMVPVGVVARLCGRDLMFRKRNSQASTYWTPVASRPDSETYHDLF